MLRAPWTSLAATNMRYQATLSMLAMSTTCSWRGRATSSTSRIKSSTKSSPWEKRPTQEPKVIRLSKDGWLSSSSSRAISSRCNLRKRSSHGHGNSCRRWNLKGSMQFWAQPGSTKSLRQNCAFQLLKFCPQCKTCVKRKTRHSTSWSSRRRLSIHSVRKTDSSILSGKTWPAWLPTVRPMQWILWLVSPAARQTS